ncbi:MAG: RluA family pseudouridine synthase [Clostridia bacterium]|nr:RluA family pseudouridine synthase [Clostridia bacterium]
MDFWIDGQNSGKTVRDFLKKQHISSALCTRLKQREDGILLNGTRVTVRAVLKEGDLLSLGLFDEAVNPKLLPLEKEVEVLLDTPDLVALNKPPFMPTHPSHGHFDDTLANVIVWQYRAATPRFSPRFVNRLDRNTSGVVLVAKHAHAAAMLAGQIAAGEMQKAYIAVVCGEISGETVLKTGIRRQNESVITREVCAVGEGDIAVTHVKPLAVKNGHTLVLLQPQTGRTHQLRVHMASLGAPILGDDLYGAPRHGIGRHALHAATLSFVAPNGMPVTVRAPLAPDMVGLIADIFGEEGCALAKQYC